MPGEVIGPQGELTTDFWLNRQSIKLPHKYLFISIGKSYFLSLTQSILSLQ